MDAGERLVGERRRVRGGGGEVETRRGGEEMKEGEKERENRLGEMARGLARKRDMQMECECRWKKGDRG